MILCLHDVAIRDDFVVGGQHTIYEWCKIYVGLDPRVASTEPTVAGQEERLRYLGAIPPLVAGSIPVPDHNANVDIRAHRRISNAVYQELATAIQTGSLEPKRRVYLEDRPGELDPTMCVLDAAPILAIAERGGDAGEVIKNLLAERRQPAASGSDRRRGAYSGALEEWLAQKQTSTLQRMPPDAFAREFKLYCERERQELLPLLPKRLRSMERTIEKIIERRVNAAKAAKAAAAKTRAGIAQ